MAEAKKDNRITTPAFRVSFHSVFEKKEQQNGKNQYCVTMLFPKDTDLDALKKAVGAACKEKWNGKPENFQSPFKDGNAKASKYESHKDRIVVEARTDYKPQIRNAANSADIEHAEVSPDGFYNGCWARAKVGTFTWSNSGKNGVSFGLSNIQKIRDDESFETSFDASEDFDAVEGASDGAVGDDSGEDWL